jgi:hypothetical protein
MLALRSFTLTLVTATVAVALLAAGCGGSSAPSGTGTHRSVLAYSQCMHAHGVPDFPDPSSSGGIDKDKIIALGNGPQINRASSACEHVMPANGLGPANNQPPPQTRFADELALARCVRSHGFPTFPDPTHAADLTRAMIASAGINLHQPALAQAADACLGVTHGGITRAMVARFIAGQ